MNDNIELLHCVNCQDVTDHVRLVKLATTERVCQGCGQRRKARTTAYAPTPRVKEKKEPFPTAKDFARLTKKDRRRVHICLLK